MIKARREQRSCIDLERSLSPLRIYDLCCVIRTFWENYFKPTYKQYTVSFKNKLKEKLKIIFLQ